MRTKLIFVFLCFLSLNVMGQGIITRQSTRKTEPKKQKSENRVRQNAPKKQQTKQISMPTDYINNHGYVDMGLSVKWASCNIGAKNPEDYGNYYAWGEKNSKSNYDWGNCFDCTNPNGLNNSNWAIYKVGGQTKISPTSGHDTARENWGGTWRMPTDAENKELCEKCKWTWTSKNGHKGYIVTGPNGNSIFLPAAGFRERTELEQVGENGYYWSSMLSSSYSYRARFLNFNSQKHNTNGDMRIVGRSVRPVTE